MTVRWTMLEVTSGDTWTVPLNPDSMSSPYLDKTLSFATTVDLRARTIQGVPIAKDWTFGGAIRTQAHHDTLVAWAQKPGKIRITDHLARTFEVMISGIQVTERQPTALVTWRLRYTVQTLLLRQIL